MTTTTTDTSTRAAILNSLARVVAPRDGIDAANFASGLSWVLALVRATRDGNAAHVAYYTGWIKSNASTLDRNAGPGFVSSVLADVVPGADALDVLDVAACDAIERVDRARGCGSYGADGRLNHRPAPYVAIVVEGRYDLPASFAPTR